MAEQFKIDGEWETADAVKLPNGKVAPIIVLVDPEGNNLYPNQSFNLKNTFTGNSNTTESISGNSIGIQNKGINDLTITVNDIDVDVEPDMTIGPNILNFTNGFTSVTVTATDAWQLFIYD